MIKAEFVHANDVWFKYDEEWILKCENFRVYEDEIVSIIGTNGSGKTTLAKLLINDIEPNKGEVKSKYDVYSTIRYQDYHKNLLPWYTAQRNFDIVKSKSKARELPASWFGIANFNEWKNQKVSSLSGGQKQILSIICALTIRSNLVVLDEPFSAIDPNRKSRFWDILYDWQCNQDVSIILITHLIDEAISLGHRVVFMRGGGEGSEQIFSKDNIDKPSNYLKSDRSNLARKRISEIFYGIGD